jgi:hypothetical protein
VSDVRQENEIMAAHLCEFASLVGMVGLAAKRHKSIRRILSEYDCRITEFMLLCEQKADRLLWDALAEGNPVPVQRIFEAVLNRHSFARIMSVFQNHLAAGMTIKFETSKERITYRDILCETIEGQEHIMAIFSSPDNVERFYSKPARHYASTSRELSLLRRRVKKEFFTHEVISRFNEYRRLLCLLRFFLSHEQYTVDDIQKILAENWPVARYSRKDFAALRAALDAAVRKATAEAPGAVKFVDIIAWALLEAPPEDKKPVARRSAPPPAAHALPSAARPTMQRIRTLAALDAAA